MVNTTPPRSSKTYDDNALEYILLNIKFYGATYKRVDVVFDDVYRKFTLKSEARVRRGQGMRERHMYIQYPDKLEKFPERRRQQD